MKTDPSALLIAEAIVRPDGRCMLLDEDNRKAGWASPGEAVESGHAFTVEPRDGIIALDLDTPELYDSAGAMVAALENARCRVVWVSSGGAPVDGYTRRHLWIVAPRWLTSDDLIDLVAEHDFTKAKDRGRAGLSTRPPLSPHRSGNTRADLIDPSHPERALNVFRSRHPKPLDPEIQQLLRDGKNGKGPRGGYTSNDKPSRQIMAKAIVTHWLYSGQTFEVLRAAMLDPTNGGGAHFHHMRPDRAEARLRAMWDEQVAWIRANPPMSSDEGYAQREELRAQLGAAIEEAAAIPWEPRTADVDYAVWVECLRRAIKARTTEVGISQRALAVAVEIGPSTAAAAMRRLEDLGLLLPAGQVPSWGTALHRINPKVLGLPPIWSPLIRGRNGDLDGLTSQHFQDVFSNGSGLGIAARHTWEALDPERPMKVREIQQYRRPSCVSRVAIRGHLRKLESHRLAARQGHAWRRRNPPPSEMKALARRLGTRGKTARREERLRQEMASQRSFLAATTQPGATYREPTRDSLPNRSTFTA